jgi:hypothetical protein
VPCILLIIDWGIDELGSMSEEETTLSYWIKIRGKVLIFLYESNNEFGKW